MSPREIHIAIDLGLQKQGSFAYDNIKPEYIDYVYNRMADQYMIDATTLKLNEKGTGFEDNTTGLSTLQELITEAELIVFNNVANKKQFSVLPHNYFSFIEAGATVGATCNTSPVAFTTTAVNEYISTVSFKTSDFSAYPTNPFSQTKIYKVINTVPIEIFDFSDFSTGLSSIDEIFTVVNKIVDEINLTQSNIKVYWQTYKGVFYPEKFIFVSNDAAFSGQAMRIAYTNSLQSTVNFTTNAYSKVNTLTNGSEIFNACRLISSEEVFHLLANPFGTTSPDSPIITISNGLVTIFIDKRFILKGLTFKFIRKPRRMNLPLNQYHELQDSRAVQKIIDMSVEYLLASIESQGFQAMAIENQQRD